MLVNHLIELFIINTKVRSKGVKIVELQFFLRGTTRGSGYRNRRLSGCHSRELTEIRFLTRKLASTASKVLL